MAKLRAGDIPADGVDPIEKATIELIDQAIHIMTLHVIAVHSPMRALEVLPIIGKRIRDQYDVLKAMVEEVASKAESTDAA